MELIYDENNDTLLLLNPTGNPANTQNLYRSTIFIDFDEFGVPILMEIKEASITLGIPKKIIKKLVGERK